MQSIFERIDGYNKSFLGFNLIGAFRNIHTWRYYILALTLGSIFAWVVLGWESTWNQVGVYIEGALPLLFGQTSLAALQVKAAGFYGVGQHLSTVVIYGLCFLFLSIHLEKNGVKKSLNFFLSASLSVMSIGIYEVIYNILYSSLQGQGWAFSFAMKQGLNLAVFFCFIAIGAVAFVYLYSLNFRPRFSKTLLLLFGLSVLTYCLWVFYPFHITGFSVQTTAGLWHNTPLFPQTMYAINMNPASGIAVGEPFFVENNLLHLVNVLNKAFMAFMVLCLAMMRQKH